MKIYWGGCDSGKGVLQKYAAVNNISFIRFRNYRIEKVYNDCKIYDYDVNDRLWWNIEITKHTYHKRKDEDFIRLSKFIDDRVSPIYHSNTIKNYSNSSYGKESEHRWDNRYLFKPDQYKKYMGRNYIDTSIYKRMVLSGNVKHTLDEITKHQEIIDWNNIISDVDLLLPLFWSCPQSIMYGENIEDARFYANYFRDVTHIMPYKEDILDSVTTKLDKVGGQGFHLCGNDLVDLYKNRKKELWEYVDRYFDYDRKTIEVLESLKINYIKFNLDRDNYIDTFGWKDFPIPREISHPQNTFSDQLHYDRWQDCIKIAKEYLNDRKDSLLGI